MPVRGMRSIWPGPKHKPTGIFGQPQKKDSTGDMPNQGAMKYAHSRNRPKPKGDGNPNLRHQPHKRWYK